MATYTAAARIAFTDAATMSAGVSAIDTSIPPSHGAKGNTTTVLMITAAMMPGTKPHFLFIFTASAIEMPASAIASAIGMWSHPYGKPWIAAVAKWPMPQTNAPSYKPKNMAAKNPAKESNARDSIGPGIVRYEPTTARAVNIAVAAIRMVADRRFCWGVGWFMFARLVPAVFWIKALLPVLHI